MPTKILRALILLLVVVLPLEAAGWLALYLFDQHREVPPVSPHLFAPFRSHKLNPDYTGNAYATGGSRHSADGFRRDTPVALDKPADTLRIVLLGGSQLYGAPPNTSGGFPRHRGLSNQEGMDRVIAARLAPLYAAQGKRLEVINAGVSEYTSYQHLVYFLERIYRYDPDFLLFLDGHNDFYVYDRDGQTVADYKGTMSLVTESMWGREAIGVAFVAARFLGQYSYFFTAVEKGLGRAYAQLATQRIVASQQPHRYSPEDFLERSRHNFLRNYALFASLGGYYDFEFMVFLQPELVFEDPAHLSPQDRELYRLTDQVWRQLGFPPEDKRLMRAQFPQLFAQRGIRFVDIGSIGGAATAEQQLYTDYTHLTAAGSAQVAERMAEAFAREFLPAQQAGSR